jgi:hypothetical protein
MNTVDVRSAVGDWIDSPLVAVIVMSMEEAAVASAREMPHTVRTEELSQWKC